MPRRAAVDRRATRTIPDDVLAIIAAFAPTGPDTRPFAALVDRLRNPPPGTHVGALERHVATNYCNLTVGITALGIERFYALTACCGGRAYGDQS